MGDNRTLACDSRTYGLANFKSNLMGKVVLIGNNAGEPTGQSPRGY